MSDNEAPRTPRQRARVETVRRIHELARGQLASRGAGELSLRAIARELGIVSSAIYRYYRSRDALITALIIEAYDDLAAELEQVKENSRLGPRRRWIAVASTFRGWAVKYPHRFALVYGTPIPGYRAPEQTVDHAARVLHAFASPVAGDVHPEARPIGRDLRQSVDAAAVVMPGASGQAVVAIAGAFARIVGLVTLELNGHLVGTFDPADALFDALAAEQADVLGL